MNLKKTNTLQLERAIDLIYIFAILNMTNNNKKNPTILNNTAIFKFKKKISKIFKLKIKMPKKFLLEFYIFS